LAEVVEEGTKPTTAEEWRGIRRERGDPRGERPG